ncbi:uncharacterized protein LOC114182635 [Vigna unguiculata]|uniref:uncharacterized protein LOC114182635 n=1 Tax=Vigna unguiculata TaxID=3917 RepID=UPI00101671DB|nr:uncharacterized protein LOC114182635 [Vigna unguiculata]
MALTHAINDKARLRTFCYTKYIVEMNGFILDRHRAKIRDTPFKWCLHMDKALAICNPLMLELVKRLGVGGIDVEFDKNVCGTVGSLLSGELITIDNVIEKMKLLVGSEVDDVDNLWAVERLGLCGPQRDFVFPRILSWPDVTLKTRRIEMHFVDTQIIWDWSLKEEDYGNELIRAALTFGEDSDAHDEDEDERSISKKALLKRLKRHGKSIRKMKKRISFLHDKIMSASNVAEEDNGEDVDAGCDVAEDGEGADVQSEEEMAKGIDLNCAADIGVRNDLSAGAVVMPCVSLQAPSAAMKVDLLKLYNSVTCYGVPYRVVCNINGQILGTSECNGFGPGMKVDNMAVLFAASTMMYCERRLFGHVKRIAFNPLYASHVLHDSRKIKVNKRQWTLKDYQTYYRPGLFALQDILTADFLFAPIVHDYHWWCYVVKCDTKQFFVLDSLGHCRKERKRIDNAIAHNLSLLFGMLMNCGDESMPKFEVHHEMTPIQPNLYDCGVIVLKMMEIWDGSKKFDGNTMPAFTNEQLQMIRQDYICQWVLDVDNIEREKVVQHFGLMLTT